MLDDYEGAEHRDIIMFRCAAPLIYEAISFYKGFAALRLRVYCRIFFIFKPSMVAKDILIIIFTAYFFSMALVYAIMLYMFYSFYYRGRQAEFRLLGFSFTKQSIKGKMIKFSRIFVAGVVILVITILLS